MDGAAFLRAYRDAPEPRAPVVLMTAGRLLPSGAATLGATWLLPKPFDIDALMELVERFTRPGGSA